MWCILGERAKGNVFASSALAIDQRQKTRNQLADKQLRISLVSEAANRKPARIRNIKSETGHKKLRVNWGRRGGEGRGELCPECQAIRNPLPFTGF